MWGIKRKWPFSPRCKKAGEEGVHPQGKRRVGSALTAGLGCVVPRRSSLALHTRIRSSRCHWTAPCGAACIRSPWCIGLRHVKRHAFDHRGALDCAWEANARLSPPLFGHRGALAAILHYHVDSHPVSAFGGVVRTRVRPLDGGDFLGRAVGGNNMRYSPRPPAPRCAPAAVFQVNGNKVIKVIASVLYI